MIILNDKQVEQTLGLVEKAAQCVMRYYQSSLNITHKSDGSPVTIADMESSQCLEAGLAEIANYPVLSEENLPASNAWLDWPVYWLIDPIDGTKGFINQTDDFCICIALIYHHRPVFGLIYSPVAQRAWLADSSRGVLQCDQVGVVSLKQRAPTAPFRVAISADNPSDKMRQLLSVLGDYDCYRRGSALKFIDLVTGRAAIYPKMWDTSEWDSAAGHCILEAVGGEVLDFKTAQPLQYGRRQSLINPHFLAHSGISSENVMQLIAQYGLLHTNAER